MLLFTNRKIEIHAKNIKKPKEKKYKKEKDDFTTKMPLI